MDEIKVGEYIRTLNGTVAKIEEPEFEVKYKLTNMQPRYLHCLGDKKYQFEDIVKHSFSIIDLIEEGDIVNEDLIVYRGKVASGKEKLLVGNYVINGMSLEVVNIKTILTHEQYERECYKLEEN